MFRSLKKASLTLGITKGDDNDSNAKKRLKHVVDTLAVLRSHITKYIASYDAEAAEHAAMVEWMRAFYPEDQPRRGSVDTMFVRAPVVKSTRDTLDAARLGLEAAFASVTEHEQALMRMVEERERVRIDIAHFESQLPKLKEKAAKHPRDQPALDEMVAKRNEAQIKFDELDGRLVPQLISLDETVAKLVDGAIAKWMEAEKVVHTQRADIVAQCLAATVSPLKEAVAVAPTADAGAADGAAAAVAAEAAAAAAAADAYAAAAAAHPRVSLSDEAAAAAARAAGAEPMTPRTAGLEGSTPPADAPAPVVQAPAGDSSAAAAAAVAEAAAVASEEGVTAAAAAS